jgi:hypothetical protein
MLRKYHLSRLVWAAALLGAGPTWAQTTINATCNRAPSGMVPLTIICSYETSTHTDPDVDTFHDIFWQHDFGDGGAGTWSHSGQSKNIEFGPVAAHVYETPGTYTWTTSARDSAGNLVSDTQTVVAYSQDDDTNGCTDARTYCYANSSGTFQGCPLDTDSDGTCNSQSGNCAVVTGSPHSIFNANAADNTCHYFRRGDSWAVSSSLNISAMTGPGIVAAFGSGAKPRFTGTTSFFITDVSDDWRLVDLEMEDVTNAGKSRSYDGTAPDGMTNFTMMRLDMQDLQRCASAVSNNAGSLSRSEGIAFVDNVCRVDDRTVGWSIFVDCSWCADLGWTNHFHGGFNGGGGKRSMHYRRGILAHGLWSASGTGTNNLITVRNCNSAADWCNPNVPSELNVYRRNTFILGNARAIRAECGDNSTFSRDFIYEGNLIRSGLDSSQRGGLAFDMAAAEDFTYRNNILNCDDPGGGAQTSCSLFAMGSDANHTGCPNGTKQAARAYAYNNTIVAEATVDNSGHPRIGTIQQTGSVCRNNLVYAPNGTSTRTADCPSGATNSHNLDDNGDYSGNPFVPATGERDMLSEYHLQNPTGLMNSGFDFESDLDGEFLKLDAELQCRPTATGWTVGALQAGGDSSCWAGAAPPAPILLP